MFFCDMTKLRFFLLLAVLCLPARPLWAWGKTGHRVVAQVAYNHLNCVARFRVDKILGKQGMVYAANWADEIKSDTIYPNSHDWHYQDFNPGMDDSSVVATLSHYPAEGGNLFRALDSLAAVLRHNPKDSDALRFVVHLMGDRFCPMHTAHLDDLGGNRVRLNWFKQPSNLHSVWDDGIISYVGYSYSEYAEYLELKFGARKRQVRKMSWAEITLANYQLCNQIYAYQESWDGNCYRYVYDFAPAVDWQLYVGGIRLAMLLNEIYG